MQKDLALTVTVITTHAPTSRGWGGAVVSGVEMAGIIAEICRSTVLVCSDANNGGGHVDYAAAQAATRAKLHLYKSRVLKKQGFGFGAISALIANITRSDGVYVSGISTWPTTLAGIIALALRKPYVISLHGGLLAHHLEEIRTDRPLKHLFYRIFVLPLVKCARFIRVSSDFEGRDAALHTDADKVVVIPNTFDISVVPFASNPPPGPGTRLVYVGRLERDKGLRAFIEVWTKVAGPDDTIAVVGSGDDSYADDIRAYAANNPRIQMYGQVPRTQVYDIIAQSHALVLPSGLDGTLRENFGNVVVEALAVGRPALVGRGLAWDDLPKYGAGWTFEPTREGLHGVLLDLLVHKAAHEPGLPASCRGFAHAKFNSSDVRHAVLGLIRACTASKNSMADGR